MLEFICKVVIRLIKMIVFDLDGTLLNSKKEVSETTKTYLKSLKQQGFILVAATGRIYSSVLQVVKDSSFLNYMITDTGSAIYDLKSNKPIYKKTIHKHLVKQILKGYNDDYNYIDVCNQNFTNFYQVIFCERVKYANNVNTVYKLRLEFGF